MQRASTKNWGLIFYYCMYVIAQKSVIYTNECTITALYIELMFKYLVGLRFIILTEILIVNSFIVNITFWLTL